MPAKPRARTTQPAEDDLDQLKRLLVGRELDQLEGLRKRVDEERLEADDVSRVLPDAIVLRGAKDDRLSKALAPTIEGSIQESVRRNPRALAEAIFPLMGPAIRKAIRQSLASMLDGVNRAVEHSLTPTGLKWRFEAWRTGRNFAEVVLSHSFVYRVEQVFFIHKETALLLEHVVASTVLPDADMISSMLGAIESFLEESFGEAGEEGGELHEFKFGEYVIHVIQGPQAILTAVVRGTPPRGLHPRLEETLEALHVKHASDLASFRGDTTPFLVSRPALESCLREKSADRKRSLLAPVIVFVGVLLVALLVTVWAVAEYAQDQRWENAQAKLAQAPGIIVLSAEEDGDLLVLRGLHDPLAPTPDDVLAAAGLELHEFQTTWEVYHSLEPELVLARANDVLEPPETVQLELDGTRLLATGRSPHAWVNRARTIAPTLAGVESFDLSGLVDVDAETYARTAAGLEGASIAFATGSATLDEDAADWKELETRLLQLGEQAPRIDLRFRVDVIGHRTPTEEEGLADARAEALKHALERSLPADVLVHVATHADASRDDSSASLRIVAMDDAR